MPQTVNGIGTHYYGKSNAEVEAGTCEFCGQFANLETYETGYYFVVLFIPIIPLGRKQILDYCPCCTQHRALPVKEWQRLKSEAIESSTTNLAQKMDDPDAAIEHLHTLTAFKQLDDAKDFAIAIEGSHPENADIQFMLGGWHEIYGVEPDADRCFDRAFEIDPNHPGAIRARGVGLIQKGKIEEAREIFQPLLPPSDYYDPTIFILLGSAFQENNQHQEALETFKVVHDADLQAGKESNFRKLVRNSEKMLGINAQQSFLPRWGLFGYKYN